MGKHDEQCEQSSGGGSECCCQIRRKDRNRSDFHRLWTEALPAKNYNKKAWLDIESQLLATDQIYRSAHLSRTDVE